MKVIRVIHPRKYVYSIPYLDTPVPILYNINAVNQESRARRLAAHTITALARVIARLRADNTLWLPIRLHL
jgi:hypothetical protein